MLGVRGYTFDRRIEADEGVHVYGGIRDRDGIAVVARAYPLGEEDEESLVERLEREFRLVESVRSEGVLRVLDMLRLKTAVIIIAEGFEGVPLDAYAAEYDVPFDVFLSIAVQLARTLADVHEAGIIHKDVRPRNVLIDAYRLRVRLKGFGLSVSVSWTSPGEEVYRDTLPYVSPEQTGRMQRRVDYRSDLYSLGATLFQLATGRPPFVGEDPVELLHAHLAREPDSLARLRPGFPVVLARIVAKLLQKAPEDRYQSATGLLRDLLRCQEHLDDLGALEDLRLADDEVAAHLDPSDSLYGRDFELGTLRGALEEVRRERALRLVLLSGQPGVGKSSLVEAALERFRTEGARCMQGRHDPYGGATPYASLRQALAEFVDEILTGTDEELELWRTRLNTALSPIAQAAVELVPKLGWVVGPQPPLPEVGTAPARRRLVEAVRRLLAAAAEQAPLVLFLDDLHWADEGSLQLLEGLVGAATPPPVLIIGAYQHRDVTVEHPLSETIDRLWAHDPTARALRVQALQAEDVNRLVADSLGRDERETAALTALVARKTDNNPLFVKQFLVYAAQIGLLDYTPDAGWTWDLSTIERAGIPDDAAAMMTDKIARLPLRMQRVLKYASVAGMRFDLDTLMALDPARDQLEEHLRGIVEEGLISRTGEGFRFTHERIREAVHAMLPPVEAARLYRLIGRHRLHEIHSDQLEERIFEVVDPLNRAVALLEDADERLQLAELDLLAGRRALETGVPRAASSYLDTALGLLRREDWDTRARLCVDIHLLAAEAARRQGETARAEELYQGILVHSLPDLHRAEVCAHLAGLYVVRGEPGRALKVGMMGLRRLGTRMDRSTSWFGLLRQALATWWSLRRTSEDAWDALRPATEPRWIVEQQITEEMALAAFFTDPRLLVAIVLSSVRQIPSRGYLSHPGLWLAALGVIVAHVFGAYKTAHRLGQRALRTLEHYEGAPGGAKARHLVHGFIEPWVAPWNRCLDGLGLARAEATRVGDIPSAAYVTGSQTTLRFLIGDPLQDVEEHAKKAAGYARDVGLEDIALSIEAIGDAAFVLRGMPSDTDVVRALALDRLEGRLDWARFDAHAVATLTLCVFGRFDEAWALGQQVMGQNGGMAVPTILGAEMELFSAVAASACAETPRGPTRRQALRQVNAARRRLRPLARACTVTFVPRLLLMEAERHRLRGHHQAAQDAYARAREAMGPAGYLHLRGLILERQASLAAERGWELESRAYLQHARAIWHAWGAESIVDDLEQRTGALRDAGEGPGNTPWTGSIIPADPALLHPRATFDLATAMDTARALSEEVDLEAVVERVLQGALANAGANRGVLMLAEEGVLSIEAEVDADGRYRHLRPPLELEDAQGRLPVAVVRLVARIAETVVLEDAIHLGRFTTDPYIVAHGVRSVLCVPVFKRTKLVGVLYLENNLVARAFTRERQQMLGMLASQAAISLENARLVEALRAARDDLEQRVEERTRELVALQDDLVSAARRAGMAEVATGVLHNVGNVLNSVNTATGDIEETLRRSRLPSLERTVDLIGTHADELASFLQEDARGRLVPEFLRLVVHQLTSEHERMHKQVASLSSNVDHMRGVIAAQQAYAGVGGIVEDVDLEALVEEAIQICGATRPWRDHVIVRQLEPVEPMRVERHKVLQILVNLVANARDALDGAADITERRIVVSTRATAGEIQVAVRDFGVGIPSENLERIFHHGFTTKRSGHGFGLHSSAIAARQLGGRIVAESEGMGRGATFTLILPQRWSMRSEAG